MLNKVFSSILLRNTFQIVIVCIRISIPPLYIGFSGTLPKSVFFFSEPKKYQSFSSLTRSYLLKVTKFFIEIFQFEFLVMTEKHFFAHKLFLPLDISDFDLFLCKNSNPFWIKSPPLSQQNISKSWGLAKPPPPHPWLKIWLEVHPPLPAERGGCTLWLFNNFECMFITVNLVFILKLKALWATLYLSLLLFIKNSFIKGSKIFEIFYNYLEAYSEPCHLSNIELFVIVNKWEAVNIFAKNLHLVYFIGLWISLCVLLTVYLKAKKIEVRQIKWRGSKYTMPEKNCHL